MMPHEHEATKHTWYECGCNRTGCMFCDGGLGSCTVCGGFEGTLPTDCPGERMDGALETRIYNGEIDYRAGRGWCEPDGLGTSMGDHARRMLKPTEATPCHE